MSDDLQFEDDHGKVRKLQVWVTEETHEKIMERTRATSRKVSEWIRAVIEKHFAETEAKTKRDASILERIEKLLKKLSG